MYRLGPINRFTFDVEPNTVQIIRNHFHNGDDIYANVRSRGDTKILWASDWDIERTEVPAACELSFGEQDYTVREGRQNIVIINQSDKTQHVLIELGAYEYIPRYWSVTATTGF